MSKIDDELQKEFEEREKCSYYVDGDVYALELPLLHTIILSQVAEERDEETNIDNGCMLSNEWLATILRTSVFRVSKVLAELHKNGYIEFYGKTSNRRIRYGKTYWEFKFSKITRNENPRSYMPFEYWYQKQEGWY